MPYTFSHPLAAVPLKKCFGGQLNLAALVVGSMSPDFGYYAEQFPAARFAHSIPGTFAICLPSGLAVLGIFNLLRESLWYLLPQPHRGALVPLATAKREFSVQALLVAAISVLLGAWTHTIWDSFTHSYGWTVERVAFLRAPAVRIGNNVLITSDLLQHLSTVMGAAGLAWLYIRWQRRQPIADGSIVDSSSDGWRYVLLGAIVTIATATGVAAAYRVAWDSNGFFMLKVFVFRVAIDVPVVFFPLLALCGIGVYFLRQRTAVETS